MKTHVYSRRSLAQNESDRYNSLANRYPPQFSELEYWTNGHTTHLVVKAKTTTMMTAEASPRLPTPRKRAMKRSRETTQSQINAVSPRRNVARDSIVAGGLSGITSTLACYPFDVLRTKMQAAAYESSSKHLGPLQALKNTLQHGGIRALYTGLSMPLTAQAVYKGTVFAVNNVSQSCLVEWKTQERRKLGDMTPYRLTLADKFFCGMIGGGVNGALFVTPVEYIRNQLIIHQHSQKASGQLVEMTGPLDVLKQTGVRGLWRGMSMTVARDSLGCGFFFVGMAYCQQALTPCRDNNNDERPTIGVTVLSGAIAGLAYWVGAMPLDTIKTWIQNGSADTASEAIRENVAKYGYSGTVRQLLRGWQMAFGRGAPSAAITVATYDTVYRHLQQ